jgi:ABC-2 type transport system permease protein
VIFFIGGLLLVTLGAGTTAIVGYRSFAKAFAGMIHIALLFVPLMALFPAAAAITEDRESGALEYFLAQPVTFGEIYAGKWAGMSVAVLLSLTIGFGTAGGVAVLRGVPPHWVMALFVFVALLALAFVAVGMCLSTIARTRARATTVGIVLWLVLVAFGSLGIITAFIRLGLPEASLVAWTFVNPVEAFRVGVIATLDTDLSLLGPIGAGIVQRIGIIGTVAVAMLSLGFWILGPGLAGWAWFRTVR